MHWTDIFRFWELILAATLFCIGWYFGSRNERRHLESLTIDERALSHIGLSSERKLNPASRSDGQLVMGSVVIAQDRFKLVIAGLLSLFGKNLTTYESLLERARREALVRMKVAADDYQCNQIYGVRIETTLIGENGGGGIEVLAYGTAVRV